MHSLQTNAKPVPRILACVTLVGFRSFGPGAFLGHTTFMIIFNDRLAKPLVGAALGLSAFASVAFADSHVTEADGDAMTIDGVAAIDDDLAAEVQRAIALLPPSSGGTSFGLIDVRAEDGMIVLSGFAEGLDATGKINRLLQDMDGLDMDKVSNEIVVQ